MILTPAFLLDAKTPYPGRFSLGALVAGVGLLLVLLGWVLPNHYPPWASFHLEAASFAGILLLAFATLLRQLAPLQLPRTAALMLLLAAVPWLQWSAGLLSFAGDAWAATAYLGATTCAWATGYASERQTARPSAAVALLGVISAAALISSGVALLQWLGWDAQGLFVMTLTPGDRPFGNLAQPNHLGTLIVMGLVGLLLIYERGKLPPLLLVAAAGMMMVGLCATQSRAAVVSWVVVGCWWLARANAAGFRLKRRQLIGFTVVLAGGFLGWGSLSEAVLLAPVRAMAVTSSNGRLEIWGQLLHALLTGPAWGYGWLQTAAAQSSVAISMPITDGFITSYSHNLLIDILIWNGLPLGTLILVTAGWLLWRALRETRSGDAVLFVAAALPVAVHSMFEFPFAYGYFLLPAALLIGASTAHRSAVRLATVPRVAGAAFVVATALVCGAIGVEYLRMEEDFRVVRFESMRVGSTDAGFRPTSAVFNSQLGAMLSMGLETARPGMPQDDLARWGQVVRRYPWPALMFKHAAALAMNERPGEVRQALLLVKALHGARIHDQFRRDLARLKETEYPQLIVPDAQ